MARHLFLRLSQAQQMKAPVTSALPPSMAVGPGAKPTWMYSRRVSEIDIAPRVDSDRLELGSHIV